MTQPSILRSPVALMVVAALLTLGLTQPARAERRAYLGVEAVVGPSLTLEISSGGQPLRGVHFAAQRKQGVTYNDPRIFDIADADQSIDVRVASNFNKWQLRVSASPLKPQVAAQGATDLNPNQITATGRGVYNGQTREYAVALGGPAVIAQGTAQKIAPVSHLELKITTLWSDRPGSYTGALSFDCLPQF